MRPAPPAAGTNYAVMKKAFEEGWGGVVAKTVSLDSSKVINVTPRCASSALSLSCNLCGSGQRLACRCAVCCVWQAFKLVQTLCPPGSYAKMKSADGKEVIGWENIELISDRC